MGDGSPLRGLRGHVDAQNTVKNTYERDQGEERDLGVICMGVTVGTVGHSKEKHSKGRTMLI